MVRDEDIVFVTTTIYSECLDVQTKIIKKMFPNSEHVLIDGQDVLNWPNSMFYWINQIKNRNEKYFILIDEDCFLTNKDEVLRTISLLDTYDYIGCPDGYHPFRICNPIIINPFLLFGKIENLRLINIDFGNINYFIKTSQQFGYTWRNSENIKYKHIYRDTFNYKHKIIGPHSFEDGKEPYYCFFWYLLDIGMKFEYLYPYYDSENISTNPKIDENSPEMAIHIWESRNIDNDQKLFGLTTRERFNRYLNLNI